MKDRLSKKKDYSQEGTFGEAEMFLQQILIASGLTLEIIYPTWDGIW